MFPFINNTKICQQPATTTKFRYSKNLDYENIMNKMHSIVLPPKYSYNSKIFLPLCPLLTKIANLLQFY